MTTPSQRPTLLSNQPSTAYRVLAGLEGRPSPPTATRSTSRLPAAHSRDISTRSIGIFAGSFGLLVFVLAFYGTLREPETLSALAMPARDPRSTHDAGGRTGNGLTAVESTEPARIIEIPQPAPSLPASTNRVDTVGDTRPASPQPVVAQSKPVIKETAIERAKPAPRAVAQSAPTSASTSTLRQRDATTASPEVDSDVELLAALIARARQQDPKPQVPCVAGNAPCDPDKVAPATR